jgi:TetR/AcrR family transcriptional regulator
VTDSASKDQILDAAEQLFAEQGFSRTTVKQIGQAAGVNSALLYYYFRDKEGLYRAVFDRLVGVLVDSTMGRLQADAPPSQKLRGFIESQVETVLANPRLPKLFVREMVDHDAEHAVEQIQHVAATSFKRLCDLIQNGQEQGLFRCDLDPRFAAISTVAQVAYFFIARSAIRILLGYPKQDLPPDVVRAFTRHAGDFALAALATDSPAAGGSRKRRTS